MKKRSMPYLAVAGAVIALLLLLNVNGNAYKKESATEDLSQTFVTDKSDRTLLKEILVSQKETAKLLKEIKMLLEEKK